MIDAAGPFAGSLAVLVACIVLVPALVLIIGRIDALGLCLAVLGSAIGTSAAALAAVVFDTTTRPWFLALVPVAYGLGLIRLVRRGRPRHVGPRLDWYSLLGAAITGAVAVVYLYRAPVQWDARSIWFFHASWFADSSTTYADIAGMAPKFSHADYPPLAASFGAFSWLFGDPRNDWSAQTATGLLTLAAAGTLAIVVSRSLESRGRRVLFGALTVLVAFGITRGGSLDGYMDGLTAILLAILAVMAFRDDDPPLVAVAALGVALTKNEGFALLLLVILPMFLILRRSPRPLLPGVVVGAVWALVIRTTGADLHQWRPLNALPWSEEFPTRFSEIVLDLTSYSTFRLALVLWLGVIALCMGAGVGGRTLKQVLGIGLAAAAVLVIEVAMYLASPHDDLTWHLWTSADRLVGHPSMILAVGGLVGLAALWASRKELLTSRDM